MHIKLYKSLYLSLVIILPLCMTFQSISTLWIHYERGLIESSAVPVVYAAMLETELGDKRYQALNEQVIALDGISSSQIDQPIPAWRGSPDKKEQWVSMWKAHLSPILYATSSMKIDLQNDPQQIADSIQAVSGVKQVRWDTNGIQIALERSSTSIAKETYMNYFFFIFLLLVLAGLLAEFPVRLRRRFVIQYGGSAAVAFPRLEWIWGKQIILNIMASMFIYAFLFAISYSFLPFHSPLPDGPTFGQILIQNAIVVGALSGAICLIGWWLKTDEMEQVSATHVPMTEWDRQ